MCIYVHYIYKINKSKCEDKCQNKVKCQRVPYIFTAEQYKAVLTYCMVELLHTYYILHLNYCTMYQLYTVTIQVHGLKIGVYVADTIQT